MRGGSESTYMLDKIWAYHLRIACMYSQNKQNERLKCPVSSGN